VSFVAPSRRIGSAAILIGLLDKEGFLPRQSDSEKKVKQVRVGKIARLHLLVTFLNCLFVQLNEDEPYRPQFTYDESWDSSALMVGMDEVGTIRT
jgi:hypothetical protein